MAAVEHDMLEEDDTFLTKVQRLPVRRLPFVSFAPTLSSSWRRWHRAHAPPASAASMC